MTPQRITGFDLARCLAIFGMILVNFKIVLAPLDLPPSPLRFTVGLLEGRAAAMFVVLAGIGMALMVHRERASGHHADLNTKRRILMRRAFLLFFGGLLYTPIWPADILHFYGVYMVIGILCLTLSSRWVWSTALLLILGFGIMLLTLDYTAEWDWETLTYDGLWTTKGMVKHLFFNGFHPVFPWAAFMLAGICLGRLDFHKAAVRKGVFVGGLTFALVFEALSAGLIAFLEENPGTLNPEDIPYLLGTSPIPPTPFYMFAAGGTAVAVIALCTMVSARQDDHPWLRPLIHTGQMALTFYVAHVIIGMGIAEAFGWLQQQSLWFAVSYGISFCLSCVIFAALWRPRFRQGPLEWVMRRLAGPYPRSEGKR